MNDHRLTRAYLESLSTDDLSRTASECGLELPSELNRNFVIEEILDFAVEDDSVSDDEDTLTDDPGTVPVHSSLPENYNDTFIGVLLRDPLWAYAFWEIRASEREARENMTGFSGYRLRVSALTGNKPNPDDECFMIPVGIDDSAWYVCLPGSCGWFRLELLAAQSAGFDVLAASAPFRVPRGRINTDSVGEEGSLPEILRLSGLDELRVLKSGDAVSRLIQHCES